MMMARSYFFILYFILFMHACKCSARPILNIRHELFPPHEIQEKFELSRNSKDSENSKAKEEEDIGLHKKNEGTRTYSGSDEEWESWLHSAMINTTKLEGERVLSQPQLKGREEYSLNSSIFSDENLTVTDYEPPHRKSPIHN